MKSIKFFKSYLKFYLIKKYCISKVGYFVICVLMIYLRLNKLLLIISIVYSKVLNE